VSNDFFKSIKFLLDKGANPDCRDKYNVSVVNEATNRKESGKEFIKSYQLLIDKVSKHSVNRYYEKRWGNSIDYKLKPLYTARHDKEQFKILIKAGTNINEPTYYNRYNKPSDTPLEMAIAKDDVKFIELVLKMGGDINLVYDKMSPIDYAHKKGKDNAEMYLLENGAKYVKYPKLN